MGTASRRSKVSATGLRASKALLVAGIGTFSLLALLFGLWNDGPYAALIALTIWSVGLAVTLAMYSLLLSRDIEKIKADQARFNRDLAALLPERRQLLEHFPKQNAPELQRLREILIGMAQNSEDEIARRRDLEQVRSQFLGNVSHELRTPIFTVQGFLETLLDGAIDDPSVRDEFLQKAHDNIVRLHTLLNDLIEISRIESGEMKMSFRYFDLIDLCRGTAVNLSDKASRQAIGISVELDESLEEAKNLEVYADRKRIEQVLVNLLDNAIKYNRPQGDVRVIIGANKREAVVSVEDNGPGISREDIDRVFERFYRVDKGRSRQIGGSGLGLSIVKHIIGAHGSSVDVSSDGSSGTRFTFRLPRHSSDAILSPPQVTNPS